MSTLAEARLEPSERRLLDRWVELLRAELGRDLHEVWLYGSRARGEHTGPESDVDLLVVTSGGARHRRRVTDLLHEAAGEDVAAPWTFSPIVYDPELLASRRSIDSFFIREVDRDRVVLWSRVGDDGPATGGEYPSSPRLVGHMRARTREILTEAREHLESARVLLAGERYASAVSSSYYASMTAARGALSEQDSNARTHGGIWHLFHQAFVESGPFDPELHQAASSALEKRIGADYHGVHFDSTEAGRIHHDAERFVTAVEAILDAESHRSGE